jgi:hypothetical protein
MLGTESPAQWYKVPPSGQVTFALTEEWAVFKGPPAASTVMGDATVAIAYLNGATQEIAFQSSGQAIYQALEHTSYIFGEGTLTWNQVGSLPPVQSSAYFPRLSLKHTTRLNFLREASLALMYLAA